MRVAESELMFLRVHSPQKGGSSLQIARPQKKREPIRGSSGKLNANSDLKMSFRRSTWNLGGEIPSG